MRIDGLAAYIQRQLTPAAPTPPIMPIDRRAEPQTAATATVAAQPSVQMLVALAAEQNAPARRRRMAAEAEAGLDALEALHAEVMAGAVSPERLRWLARWTRSRSRPDDPRLAALTDEIDLRVQVELAKREPR